VLRTAAVYEKSPDVRVCQNVSVDNGYFLFVCFKYKITLNIFNKCSIFFVRVIFEVLLKHNVITTYQCVT